MLCRHSCLNCKRILTLKGWQLHQQQKKNIFLDFHIQILVLNYWGIIIIRGGPVFVAFVGNPCPRIYIISNIYTSIDLIFIKKSNKRNHIWSWSLRFFSEVNKIIKKWLTLISINHSLYYYLLSFSLIAGKILITSIKIDEWNTCYKNIGHK